MMTLINFASNNVPMKSSSNCIVSLKDRLALICETICSFDLIGNLDEQMFLLFICMFSQVKKQTLIIACFCNFLVNASHKTSK